MPLRRIKRGRPVRRGIGNDGHLIPVIQSPRFAFLIMAAYIREMGAGRRGARGADSSDPFLGCYTFPASLRWIRRRLD